MTLIGGVGWGDHKGLLTCLLHPGTNVLFGTEIEIVR